jgi:ABC-type sulfate transport system substrate-binding protein
MVTQRKGTEAVARAYLGYLSTPEGQEVIERHQFRPGDGNVFAKHASEFPSVPVVTVGDLGGWNVVQPKHFADWGLFDQTFAHR